MLFASWVSLSHPQCPFLWSHHSFKVYQGGATEPSGAAGPHQHTYSFQEDHQTEPAAEAGGGAGTQGECVLVGEDTGTNAWTARWLKLLVRDHKEAHHLIHQYWGPFCL